METKGSYHQNLCLNRGCQTVTICQVDPPTTQNIGQNGTRAWHNLLWTCTSCKGRVGNVIELEGLGKIPTERQTWPIVLDMFKTIGKVMMSALNGVGTQCGRGISVTTTTLSCGGRVCSRQDQFENLTHVSVSPSYLLVHLWGYVVILLFYLWWRDWGMALKWSSSLATSPGSDNSRLPHSALYSEVAADIILSSL